MKKNRMMRAASALLVAVLLTTCTISGTFAKYTTKQTGGDEARVAKFGVEITAIGTMFAKEYDTKDAADVAKIGAKSVISSENVVAPGTSGELSVITVSGTPEVAVEVKYEATVEFGDLWKAEDDSYYCPIEITVDGSTIKGLECSDIGDFESKVKAAIEGQTKKFAPGTDLASQAEGNVAISWAWLFEGNDDVKDTFLGDQADAGNAATIDIDLICTVTQID